MDETIPFVCPKCGCKIFKTSVAEIRTINDFLGAVCSECGSAVTEDDIKAQGLAIAEKALKEAFGNLLA